MPTKTAKNPRFFIYSAYNRTSLSFGFGGVWQDGRVAATVADVIETCFVWACPSISGFGWLSWRSHNWSSQRPAGAGHQRPSRPPGKLDISLQSRYQFRISLIMEAEEEVSQVCVSMVVQFAQPAHRIFRKRLDDVYQRSKFSTDWLEPLVAFSWHGLWRCYIVYLLFNGLWKGTKTSQSICLLDFEKV